MNKNNYLRFIRRSLFLSICMMIATGFFAASGQVALPHHQPFDYTAGQALQTQTGWTALNTGDNIDITAGSLTYAGLPAPTGNKASFAGAGIDAYLDFTSQATGTVYYSFLLNVKDVSLATEPNGGYFLGFIQAGSTTAFGGTVWTRRDGAGYQLGVEVRTATGASTTFTSGTPYAINTTYLVVVSYTFNSGGTGDDVAKLWVNPTLGQTNEPTALLTDSHTGTDLTSAARFLVRQDSDTETPSLDIDELRIGTTWASVTPTGVASPTIAVSQNATTITNNNSPAFNMGTVVINNNLDVTFTITNGGAANLTLTTPIGISGTGFSVLTQPATTVGFATGSNTTTFVVRFNSATTINNATGTVTIANNAGANFVINLMATAVAAAAPSIAITQGTTTITNNNSPAFNMGTVVINNNLDVTFTVTNAGTANLTLTTPIGVSGAGFSIQTQPATTVGFATGSNTTTFVVRFNSATAVNNATGTVTIANNAGANFVINLTATATATALATYAETFNTSCTGSFSTFSVSGDQSWQCVNFGINPTNSPMAQMNGFAFGATQTNEDWLISPLVTLSGTSILSFWTQASFTGNNLTVRISETYLQGNPNGATWTDITANAAPALATPSGGGTPSAWVQSFINLSTFANREIRVAFVYTSSSGGNAARWSVDDVAITNAQSFIYTSATQLPTIINTTTSTQSYSIISNGISSVSVTPPTGGIEISKMSGSGFGTSALTFTAAELAVAATSQVFVRFRPSAPTSQVISGNISNVVGGKTLNVGVRAIDKTRTLDVVTLNMAWFSVSTMNGGTSEVGPANNAGQVDNMRQLITLLDADVYALQEVGNDNIGGGVLGFDKLTADLAPLGYTAIRSPHPDIFNPTDNPGKIQRLGFIYKTSALSNVRTRVMIQGASVPSDYPGTAARFFAGNRFPWLMVADVNIGGVTRNRVHFISFHARANGTESTTDQLYAMRRYDVNILKDTLDMRYNRENIIFLGDYNDEINFTIARNIQSAGFVGTTESSYRRFADDTQGYTIPTRGLSSFGFTSFIGSAHVIDHIAVSNELAGNLIANSAIVENMLPLISDYRNTTSDHLPVSVSLDWSLAPTTNTGTLMANPTSLSFGDVSSGQSRELTYTLSGSNLTGNITLTSSSGLFQIARSTGNFVGSLVIPATDLASPQAIRVRFAPNANNAGVRTATISHVGSSGNITPLTFNLTGNEVVGTVALEEFLATQASIYPNPATDVIKIKIPKENITQTPHIQVLDINGKFIFEKNLTETSENFESTLNLSSFTKGIYLIQISIGKATHTKKIIIK